MTRKITSYKNRFQFQHFLISLVFITLITISGDKIFADTIPIRLHPDNPHYLEFRGEPTVLVTSAEHYGALINLDFDYVAYFDELYAKGNNYSRVFVGSFVLSDSDSPLSPAPNRFIAPWARSQVDGYRFGGNKFDLDTWDTAYFSRLHDFVYQAGIRGIVLEFTMFSVLYDNVSWWSSPLYKRSNINGIGNCTKEQALTMDNGNLLAYQKAMVAKIVEELEGYDNLFFEICNEPYIFDADEPSESDPELSQKFVHMDWQREIVDAINTAQQNFTHKFLIAQNIDQVTTVITKNEGKLTDAIDSVSIFNFHYNARFNGRINSSIGDNYHLNKVIACDETGNYKDHNQDEVYRKQAWNYLFAGGAIYNNLDFTFQVDHPGGHQASPVNNHGGGETLRTQLGYLRQFMSELDFIAMEPHNDLPKSNGIVSAILPDENNIRCLSKGEEQYVFYIEQDGEGSSRITLNLPDNEYLLSWFDVKQNRHFDSTYINHFGGELVINTPVFIDDIVFELAVNTKPIANAGADQTIQLPVQLIQLEGSVSDDGLPIGNTPEITWSLFSGPNAVSFNNKKIAKPEVTFLRDGTYILKMEVSDGELTSEDYTTILVLPGDDLIAYWQLDETTGTIANDLYHAENDGSLMNGQNFDEGSNPSWHENALKFDGMDDYILVPDEEATALNMGESDFSISLFMQWDSLWTDRMYFVSKTDGDNGYALRMDVKNTFSATLFKGSKRTVKSISIPEIDKWNHIVAVFDRTNHLLSLYLNGEFENSISIPDGNIDNAADFFIGAYNHPLGPKLFFNGLIDELRIYNRPLGSDEIYVLYNATRPNLAPVVDAGPDKVMFLPETNLLLEGSYEDDGLPVNSNIDVLWEKVSGPGHVLFSNETDMSTNTTLNTPGTYEIKLSVTDGLLTSADTMNIVVYPQTDLIGHWMLDETSGITASDNSGLDNAGELQEGMTFNTHSVEGHFGNALIFNGTSEFVSMGDPEDGSLDMGESSFSISAWIYMTENNNQNRVIVNKMNGGSTGYSLRLNEGNKLKAHFRTESSNITCFSDEVISEGEWHHVAAVYDRISNLLKLYLDGYETASKEIGSGSLNNDYEFRIGANGSGSSKNSFMKGSIDDVRLYNIILTDSQTYDLYNGPASNSGPQFGTTTDEKTEEQTVTTVHAPINHSGEKFLTTYPNPVKNMLTIEFSLPSNGHTVLSLYNSAGIKMVDLYDGNAEKGTTYKINYNLSGNQPGLYYLILREDGSRKMVRKIFLME